MSDDDLDRIVRGYRFFADVEAAAVSPRYAELARAVIADDDVLRFVVAMPVGKRQPDLLFAALQFLHGRVPETGELRGWVCDDAERLRCTMLARATQTNEPARCTALLPVLDALPGPLARIEVGSSAGLCLYPDRYSYDYDGVAVGPPSTVRLRCAMTGGDPVPRRVPEAVEAAPAGCTVVVLHPAVMPYVPGQRREAFVRLVRELPVRWIAQEGLGALAEVDAQLPVDEARGRLALSLDGRPLAWTAPHGGRVDWLPGAVETIRT